MTDWSNCMDWSRGKRMNGMSWSMDCRCHCMVDWGGWSNVEGSRVGWDRHRMDWCGVVERSCMVGHSVRDWSCMVGNGMMHWGCMMSNGMVEWSSMMSDSMVNRRSMMDHSMVWVSMSHNWRRDGVAILIKDGFGQVWVEEGVGVEAVEGHCCAAVHRVPELAP